MIGLLTFSVAGFTDIVTNSSEVNRNTYSPCLKITEKVLFNIASEMSYAYVLNGKK